jgi:ectoine hydroxylase-related dioxygenase (phytanoyl-CoA dioxygenase family)
MLTSEQVASFHERGYLRLPRLLSPEEVTHLREALDDVLSGRALWPDDCFQTLDAERYRAPSGRPMPEGIQQPAGHDARFRGVADHPTLVSAMQALIGPGAVRYTDQVILKTPGISPATFFHQDGFYWRNSGERTVNCWIALDDAGPGNGCLVFLPGSHRHGLQEHEAYYDEPALHHGRTGRPFQRLRIPLDRAENAAEVCEPVPSGGCLFFTKYTWHRSDPNRSQNQRRAYAIAYHLPAEEASR